MKKIILVLILVSCNLSFAQTGWFWQNPKPQGQHLTDVKFINTNIAIATCRGYSILKSTDMGVTWTVKNITPVDIRRYSKLHSINVINPNTIFITQTLYTIPFLSEFYRLLKSTDGGESWTSTDIPNFNSSYDFVTKFINYNTGFLYTNSRDYPNVYRTTNSGLNWARFSVNSNDSLSHVFFLNENTGWVGSRRGAEYYKTTNGGTSWNTYSLPSLGGAFDFWDYSFFINENTGWFSTLVNSYKTTNGGTNWINTTSGQFSNILFFNASTGFKLDPGGIVFKTTNAGTNWVSNFSEFGFQNFGFSGNNLNGITVANYGEIYITTNAGTNWNNIYTSITPLFTYPDRIKDIQFVNSNTGWTVIADRLYKSTNGGNNWNLQISAAFAENLNFKNENTGLITGSANVSRTTNGGLNWNSTTFSSFSFPEFVYSKNDTVYVRMTGFDSSAIFRTTNFGANWIITSTAYQTSGVLFFVNSRTGYSSSGISISKTTDAGYTWSVVSSGYASKMHFINESIGFINSDSGIFKTTNGGVTFTPKIYFPYYFKINSFSFINDRTGWAAGGGNAKGMILKTTDEGDTWMQNNNADCSTLNKIIFLDNSTGWACGDDGSMIKTTTGGTIGIQQISASVPDKFYLEQNYPNPFNPNTNIEFSIPQKTFVKLKVFDLLGREIANLVNENLSAGKYKYDFNASALPSGIYFYKLETENFSETRKMVLIK